MTITNSELESNTPHLTGHVLRNAKSLPFDLAAPTVVSKFEDGQVICNLTRSSLLRDEEVPNTAFPGILNDKPSAALVPVMNRCLTGNSNSAGSTQSSNGKPLGASGVLPKSLSDFMEQHPFAELATVNASDQATTVKQIVSQNPNSRIVIVVKNNEIAYKIATAIRELTPDASDVEITTSAPPPDDVQVQRLVQEWKDASQSTGNLPPAPCPKYVIGTSQTLPGPFNHLANFDIVLVTAPDVIHHKSFELLFIPSDLRCKAYLLNTTGLPLRKSYRGKVLQFFGPQRCVFDSSSNWLLPPRYVFKKIHVRRPSNRISDQTKLLRFTDQDPRTLRAVAKCIDNLSRNAVPNERILVLVAGVRQLWKLREGHPAWKYFSTSDTFSSPDWIDGSTDSIVYVCTADDFPRAQWKLDNGPLTVVWTGSRSQAPCLPARFLRENRPSATEWVDLLFVTQSMDAKQSESRSHKKNRDFENHLFREWRNRRESQYIDQDFIPAHVSESDFRILRSAKQLARPIGEVNA